MPLSSRHPDSVLADLVQRLESGDPGDVRDHVGLAIHERVAIVTLARPDRLNAMSLAAWRRVSDIIALTSSNADVRVTVLRGLGDRAFGAGADISEFASTRMTPAAALEYNEAIARALRSIEEFPRPVIAMVHGLAVGGGCELACACDLRICADDARLGIPIGRLGVTLGHTETRAVLRLIGPSRLKWLLMSGELITAKTALAIGLVDQVIPRAMLAKRTAGLVEAILGSSQATMHAAKVVTNMAARELLPEDTETLTRIAVDVYGGADLPEGVAAFLSHRDPKFAP